MPFLAAALLLTLTTTASPSLDLVDEVTGPRGCAPRLLGSEHHPFIEAQIACDAFLGLAIVGEALGGKTETPAAIVAVRRLLADAKGRGATAFEKSPASILRRGYQLLLYSGLGRLKGLTAEEAAAYDTLARAIAADVEAAAPAFVESFNQQFWPCDSSPAAAGLVLHGSLRGDEKTRAAGLGLVKRLEERRLAQGGFVTKVDGKGGTLEATPRGTVMAWTAGFLALAGVPEARAFADDLFARFCGRDVLILGVKAPASCREWPRDVDRKADAVSGPIVDGQGTGASALAIAAFRATGRTDDADRLTSLAAVAAPAFALMGKPVHQGPLERAILLWGASARSWATARPTDATAPARRPAATDAAQ
ncbi:MAG TPA: hypothetical protein VGK67_38245 [Myxococcales bacterium]|jgi:hypothetical protein